MRSRSTTAAERGAAMVELAFILPLTMLLAFGAADFARAFHLAMQLTLAARTGAQVGAQSLGESTDIGLMTSAAVAATDVPGITATAEQVCYCLNDGNGQLASPTVVCSMPPPSCDGGAHFAIYAQVAATKVFTPLTRLPGISTAFAITRTARQRVVN